MAKWPPRERLRWVRKLTRVQTRAVEEVRVLGRLGYNESRIHYYAPALKDKESYEEVPRPSVIRPNLYHHHDLT